MSEDTNVPDLLVMTTGVIANYVANNRVEPSALPALIAAVHASFAGLGEAQPEPVEAYDKPTSAQIRKSVTDAGIVSFLDGKTYQSMRRHLTNKGLTPETYRERFGLPANYPIVAPAYAARRSALAKAAGLGQGGRQAARKGKAS